MDTGGREEGGDTRASAIVTVVEVAAMRWSAMKSTRVRFRVLERRLREEESEKGR